MPPMPTLVCLHETVHGVHSAPATGREQRGVLPAHPFVLPTPESVRKQSNRHATKDSSKGQNLSAYPPIPIGRFFFRSPIVGTPCCLRTDVLIPPPEQVLHACSLVQLPCGTPLCRWPHALGLAAWFASCSRLVWHRPTFFLD